jgi:hypothetical protein
MATIKKFIWLLDTTFPRRGSVMLEKGKEYDAAAFPSHVVEEWIRTGAARSVSGKPEKKTGIGE